MTAAQYYRANTEKDCDTAFEAVQSILDGEAGPSPPPLTPITSTPKCTQFSEKQNAIVKDYFAEAIT